MGERMTPRLELSLSRLIPYLFAGFVLSPGLGDAQELDPRQVLEERCSGCHAARSGGGFERISDIRKTPEGWEMTIVRMGIWHDVEVPEDELALLVGYLADAQGLAPSETTGQRFILERQPNVVEDIPNEQANIICARCHSYARVALQRRDEEEWRKLSHAHLGQHPTTEYQSLGRDRDWWGIARDKMPKVLSDIYPFRTDAWEAWRNSPKTDISGTWRIRGDRPGVGRYTGTAEITSSGRDQYETTYSLHYSDGTEVPGESTSLVYTGYEWRGSAKLGDEEVREVFALGESGNTLDGRWFLADADEIGADFHAVRVRESETQIMSVEPPMLRAGTETALTVHGYGLKGNVNLGTGIKIIETVFSGTDRVKIIALADAAALPGSRTITVGGATIDGGLTVFNQIDSIRVEPPFGISRVGGGTTPAVTAQFSAIAYLNGPDGKPGTNDDIRMGNVPAQWSIENFDEEAEEMKDRDFVGAIDQNGTFAPAGAGPNPERKYKTNNAGRVTVKALVSDGGQELEGSAEMVVTVQRWNSPPIL